MNDWDIIKNLFVTGQLGRRDFIRYAVSLGITAGVIKSKLTSKAFAETPKRGGHLKMAVNGASTKDSLDPARFNASYMSTVGRQFYDQLTTVDENLEVRPALAESWETKPGAREWVFKLRSGVTFHNGKEMTASDVVYSINHHRGPDSKSSAKAIVVSIEDIRETGPLEFTVTLSSGNADMPYLFSSWHLGIAPDGANFAEGIGTGAFVVESFEPGVRTIGKRNQNDWRTDRGYVDSVETLAITDSSARMAALQSGAVHIVNKLIPNLVPALQADPAIQVFSVSGGTHQLFAMRCDQPPYDNLDLRLAMKYAIDRETILKTNHRGLGKIGNDHPIPEHDPFFASDIPQRPYDPDKAKFHFKKSGASGPLVLSVSEAPFTGAAEMATVYQGAAAKAGIPIEVNRVPVDGYFASVWMHHPFTASNWGGRPTADLMLTNAYLSTASYNETFWYRPKFDQLLVAARAETDVARRKQMYHDLQFMIHEDGGAVIPVFANLLDGASNIVRGFVPSPFQQMAGYKAAEQVWLDV
jgi:peptide/nickel transport system substrate-binding protein